MGLKFPDLFNNKFNCSSIFVSFLASCRNAITSRRIPVSGSDLIPADSGFCRFLYLFRTASFACARDCERACSEFHQKSLSS